MGGRGGEREADFLLLPPVILPLSPHARSQALKTATGQRVTRPVGLLVLVVEQADIALSEAISLPEPRSSLV